MRPWRSNGSSGGKRGKLRYEYAVFIEWPDTARVDIVDYGPNITATIYAHLLGDSQLDEAAAAFERDARPGNARAPRAGRSLRQGGSAK